MTVAVACALLGLGVLVWPVPTASARRLRRLRQVARVGVAPTVARVRGGAGPDRGRAVAGAGVLVAAVVAGLASGVAVGLAAGATTAAVAVVTLSSRAARREARRRRDLVTALSVLRGELDAGTPFPDALEAARERSGAAAATFDLDAAVDPPGAFGSAAEGGVHVDATGGARAASVGGPRAAASGGARSDAVGGARRCLAAGAGLVAVTGAPWSAVADGIARDVAARDARDREVDAALAGARASTVVLAGLPVLGLGLAATLGADPAGFLLHTRTGTWVLAAGVVLDLVGVLASSALATRAAR